MPFSEGVTLTGWGVVRPSPWHFIGIYETNEIAMAVAAELGTEYEVHFGDNREGTDDFVWSNCS